MSSRRPESSTSFGSPPQNDLRDACGTLHLVTPGCRMVPSSAATEGLSPPRSGVDPVLARLKALGQLTCTQVPQARSFRCEPHFPAPCRSELAAFPGRRSLYHQRRPGLRDHLGHNAHSRMPFCCSDQLRRSPVSRRASHEAYKANYAFKRTAGTGHGVS